MPLVTASRLTQSFEPLATVLAFPSTTGWLERPADEASPEQLDVANRQDEVHGLRDGVTVIKWRRPDGL